MDYNIKQQKKIILLLIFGIVLIYVGIFLIQLSEKKESGITGYYIRDQITIKVSMLPTFDDYIYIAMHEYAHHVWAKEMTKQDLRDWNNAIKTCGYESDYAKSFKSASTKIQEEFADDVSRYYIGQFLCQEKINVISKYVHVA
jgi:hypothetical protein